MKCSRQLPVACRRFVIVDIKPCHPERSKAVREREPRTQSKDLYPSRLVSREHRKPRRNPNVPYRTFALPPIPGITLDNSIPLI
jgi:hypothetical protein